MKLEERNRKLMESIRESKEVKQQILQIAAAQEEKKSWWNKIFSFSPPLLRNIFGLVGHLVKSPLLKREQGMVTSE
ncbi:DUF3967 domain-containing protein [Bacillus sp. BP-3]|uniref:DUF3967 domain-containing protein n=1 Tax=Bacillus sp. BP-3 TaxID=3022773 RepID=UPI0023311862|nr:DUF3967 domain-containing protein [Bacillus sp. BP-3]MDC2867858.1 DUF3967 domain-containing protein [Bacillus sp. BP-3]